METRGVLSILLLLFSLQNDAVQAQLNPAGAPVDSIFNEGPVSVVNEISTRIEAKRAQRQRIINAAKAVGKSLSAEDTALLDEIDTEVNRLQESLVLSITGKSTLTSLYAPTPKDSNWQEDIVDIIRPLVDTLKSLTRRPREIADLRASLATIEKKQAALTEAIDKFAEFESAPLQQSARTYIQQLTDEWNDDLEQLDGEKLITARQLEDMLGVDDKPFSGLLPGVKRFAAGTGLTLLLAFFAGAATYFFMRAIWWVYSNRIASKEVRRKSTLYRLFSYSFYLVTGVFVLLSVLLVLYAREDLLLMAVSFLLLAGLVLNLKQFLPKYVAEARLLLNLGSVREDERVVYNGLPWQVKSINLYSVLHNPALDGIVRLPLSELRGLVSRPVRNNLWFPTQRGDFVLLPDGPLGRIKYQTPDLVELTVRGGMAQTFATTDFYTLNTVNLTRDETFGVSVTFGLDYALQSDAVTGIPDALRMAVQTKIKSTDLHEHLQDILVELSAANSSSLDFLVYGTFSKAAAGNYYRIERLLVQACVGLCNERGWTIPFPQLTVHQAS
jgi:hypothetical protein